MAGNSSFISDISRTERDDLELSEIMQMEVDFKALKVKEKEKAKGRGKDEFKKKFNHV